MILAELLELSNQIIELTEIDPNVQGPSEDALDEFRFYSKELSDAIRSGSDMKENVMNNPEEFLRSSARIMMLASVVEHLGIVAPDAPMPEGIEKDAEKVRAIIDVSHDALFTNEHIFKKYVLPACKLLKRASLDMHEYKLGVRNWKGELIE